MLAAEVPTGTPTYYGLPGARPGLPGAVPPGRSRSEIEMGKVFIGGLARETTTEGLRGYFERFGDISDCVVMKDRSTGLPRGFGFVTYASQLVADRVVHHRHMIDGKEVEAKPAVPRDSEMLARPGALAGLPGLPGMAAPGFVPSGLPAPAGPGGPTLAPANFGAGGGSSVAEGFKKIFVGGLSHETSEADFNAYFGTHRPTRARHLHPGSPSWGCEGRFTTNAPNPAQEPWQGRRAFF